MEEMGQIEELLDFLIDKAAIAGALAAYRREHPDDPAMANSFSVAKRIRGQIQVRLHNLQREQANLKPHWYKHRNGKGCGRCSLSYDHDIHLKCGICGSAFHESKLHTVKCDRCGCERSECYLNRCDTCPGNFCDACIKVHEIECAAWSEIGSEF